MHHSNPVSRQSWWKDPSTLGDIVTALAAATAVFLTALDLLGLSSFIWFSSNISKLTLFLVSYIVLSGITERRLLINRLHISLLEEVLRLKVGPYQGLTSIYANRNQLPPYDEFVGKATKEVFISGIEFGYVALHQLPALESRAVSGCKIRLMLVDPDTSDGQPNPLVEMLRETLNFPQLREVLIANLNRLKFWKSQMSPIVSKRVEIRVTKAVPTHIATFVDKDFPTGTLSLEMLPPKTDVTNRWLVSIPAETGGELYSKYNKAYEQLWSEARPWESYPNT